MIVASAGIGCNAESDLDRCTKLARAVCEHMATCGTMAVDECMKVDRCDGNGLKQAAKINELDKCVADTKVHPCDAALPTPTSCL